MKSFHYKLTTFTTFLEQLAGFLKVSMHNNTVEVPAEWGSGYWKVINLGEGLEAIVYNYKMKEDLQLLREKDKAEYYTLVLEEFDHSEGISLTIEHEKLITDLGRTSALYLTSFLYDVESVLSRDTTIKGVRVLLTQPWMQQYLQIDKNEDVLERYINLKTAGIWNKPVDEESKYLFHQLLEEQQAPLLFYQNKILLLVEKFFTWLYDKTKFLEETAGISRPDIESAQKVEYILTNDVTVLPPTITELARTVAMSESKLKKIFKTVYGLPPYEYYQKHRMQKARLMLLSGKYSIKDIGYTLGYANLSNFTLAFKKAFGKLPSEMVRKAS